MLPDGTKKEKEEMNHTLIIFIVGSATACLHHLDKRFHGGAGGLQTVSD